MLNCKEVSELVSRSLDEELPLGKRVGVRMHLLMCKFCTRYKKQMVLLRELARRYEEKSTEEMIPTLPSLQGEARKRIKDLLAGQGSGPQQKD
jgi:predicted anti-sigma-YlaC factor YlaD